MTKEMTGFKFYFRNEETWTIQREQIGDLWIKQITTSFGRIHGGDFQKINPCAAFKIEIFQEADHVKTDDINLGGLELGMFERATKFQDIEKMGILFDNGEEDLVYFPYLDKGTPGQEGLDNQYQSSKISKDKKLYIVIDPEKDVTEVYAEQLNG